jgi:hypothetical protein
MKIMSLFKKLLLLFLGILFFFIFLLSLLSWSAYHTTSPSFILPVLQNALEKDKTLKENVANWYKQSSQFFQKNPEEKYWETTWQKQKIKIFPSSLSLHPVRFRQQIINDLAHQIYYLPKEKNDITNVFSYGGHKMFLLMGLASLIILLIIALILVKAFSFKGLVNTLTVIFLLQGILFFALQKFLSSVSLQQPLDVIILSFLNNFKNILSFVL